MPTPTTYPGVYIEELPSGVRTITGVSTSVTAFVGTAPRGPINKATRVLGFADYERRFGGLAADFEMGYAVRQFFVNGGSEAFVVRTAKDAEAASAILKSTDGVSVLELKALDQGKPGNDIRVFVDHGTTSPASTFNLTLTRVDPNGPANSVVETFLNVSMNKRDARYVENVVNGTSELVTITRIASAAVLAALPKGRSDSAPLDDLTVLPSGTYLDSAHFQFRLSLDGATPVNVALPVPAVPLAAADATSLAQLTVIRDAINQVTGVTCTLIDTNTKLRIEPSGPGGESSTVRVLPGLGADAAGRLKLGSGNGGTETDGASTLRPKESPGRSVLDGTTFTAAAIAAFPDNSHYALRIALDRGQPITLALPKKAPGTPDTTHGQMAALIQKTVREASPFNIAFSRFTCERSGVGGTGNALVLTSGTRGKDSYVEVIASPADRDIAAVLELTGQTATTVSDVPLAGGAESDYSADEAYPWVIGNRSRREGLFALESVDLFNLLCLPGVSNPGILADAAAYCTERRAFMIIDAPAAADKPEEMLTTVSGTTLPKTDRAAVYYPWIKIADPLNNGKPRAVPPSGTMAGLYARTDSARGVWKAPAGIDAPLVGVQGVDYALTDPENGYLNPRAVNCIRVFPVYGAVAWGARTLDGDDQKGSEWKYIPVRRTALYIEESLYRGLKWVVFEPNDEPLWGQVRLNVGAFMHDLFRKQAFKGTTPRDAYFVKCDKETTTQNDINLGRVNVLVGFAPLKPAEFVIVQIQQIAGQIQT